MDASAWASVPEALRTAAIAFEKELESGPRTKASVGGLAPLAPPPRVPAAASPNWGGGLGLGRGLEMEVAVGSAVS